MGYHIAFLFTVDGYQLLFGEGAAGLWQFNLQYLLVEVVFLF